MTPSEEQGLSTRRRPRRCLYASSDAYAKQQNAFLVAMLLIILGAVYVRRNYMERTNEPGSKRLVFRTAEAIAAREERRRQRLENLKLEQSFGINGSSGGGAVFAKRKRAVVRQPRWAGLWESSLATAFTSCRKLQAAPAMANWQQPCAPKPWAHFFRSGPLDCTFLGTDYGGFYLPNRMCFLNEFEPSRPPVAYGFGIGSDVSYDLALASAYPSLKVRMFDPTPYALTHAAAVLETVERREPSCKHISAAACQGDYFRAIADSKVRRSQLSVHPWAIGTADGSLRFYRTPTGSLYHDDDEGNATLGSSSGMGRRQQQVEQQQQQVQQQQQQQPKQQPKQHPPKPPPGQVSPAYQPAQSIDLPVKKLTTIMKTLGDAVVDILKIDIEVGLSLCACVHACVRACVCARMHASVRACGAEHAIA